MGEIQDDLKAKNGEKNEKKIHLKKQTSRDFQGPQHASC